MQGIGWAPSSDLEAHLESRGSSHASHKRWARQQQRQMARIVVALEHNGPGKGFLEFVESPG